MRNFFNTIKLIWQGWTNMLLDLISDIRYKREFEERYEICKVCDHNSYGFCDICGCLLKAKTKSEDSECPMKKWLTIKETLKK